MRKAWLWRYLHWIFTATCVESRFVQYAYPTAATPAVKTGGHTAATVSRHLSQVQQLRLLLHTGCRASTHRVYGQAPARSAFKPAAPQEPHRLYSWLLFLKPYFKLYKLKFP